MIPYYEDDSCTIYHGDCYEIVDGLTFALVVTDPPYGMGVDCDYSKIHADRMMPARGNRHDAVIGDDAPFDPAPWLAHPVALFGPQHFASRLPDGGSWHVWDKRDGIGSNMMADFEMWWTSWSSGPSRLFRHKWLGFFRPAGRSEGVGFVHPTMKPVALMRHILSEKRTPPGVVLDPFMGSGTTLRAAKDLGRRAIGVEIEERYCEIAANRLAQEVLPFEGIAAG